MQFDMSNDEGVHSTVKCTFRMCTVYSKKYLQNPDWYVMEFDVSNDEGRLDVFLTRWTFGIVAEGLNLNQQ